LSIKVRTRLGRCPSAFYVPLGVLLNGLLLIIIRVCRSAQQGVQNVGFFTNSLEQKFF
jgi:hypothetical protein